MNLRKKTLEDTEGVGRRGLYNYILFKILLNLTKTQQMLCQR